MLEKPPEVEIERPVTLGSERRMSKSVAGSALSTSNSR